MEKFAINSLLSATHTAEMDSNDQKDIIKKVKTSGANNNNDEAENNSNSNDDNSSEEISVDSTENIDEMSLNDHKAKAILKIYDDGNDEIKSILNRLVSFNDNVSREEFINDLREEIDNEAANEIIEKLKDLGINIGVFIQENFVNIKKISTFDKKNMIKNILRESLNDSTTVKPETKPKTKPSTTEPSKPSRRDKPFNPQIHPSVKPRPKAIKETDEFDDLDQYYPTFSSAMNAALNKIMQLGYTINNEKKLAKRPIEGETNSYSIELIKNGSVSDKTLKINVHNLGSSYELDMKLV